MVRIFYSDKKLSDSKQIYDVINSYALLGENLDYFEIQRAKQELLNLLENINISYQIENSPNLSANSFAKRIIKKIIYKLCGWYFDSICKRQSEINAQFVRTLNCYKALMDYYEKRIDELDKSTLSN